MKKSDINPQDLFNDLNNAINLKKGNINDLKTFFYCDTLFKSQGYFWIVNKIKNISYEEIE
jgi:hypothetical protein